MTDGTITIIRMSAQQLSTDIEAINGNRLDFTELENAIAANNEAQAVNIIGQFTILKAQLLADNS